MFSHFKGSQASTSKKTQYTEHLLKSRVLKAYGITGVTSIDLLTFQRVDSHVVSNPHALFFCVTEKEMFSRMFMLLFTYNERVLKSVPWTCELYLKKQVFTVNYGCLL